MFSLQIFLPLEDTYSETGSFFIKRLIYFCYIFLSFCSLSVALYLQLCLAFCHQDVLMMQGGHKH